MIVNVSWRRSLGAAALAAMVTCANSASAQSEVLLFRGSYVCGQGLTAVEIMLPSLRNGTEGEFRFGGGQVPRGRFSFTLLSKTGDDFLLKPLRWIEQPRGFTMIGAEVTIRSSRLLGQITARACGRITATEISVQGTPPTVTAETTVPAPSAITAQLKEILRQDALWWHYNALDTGSAGSAYRITSQDGADFRLPFTYNKGSAGWIVGRYDAQGKLQCVVLHNDWANCRAPRTEATLVAQDRAYEAAQTRRKAEQAAADRAAGVHMDGGLRFARMDSRSKASAPGCLFTAADGEDRETASLRDEYGKTEELGTYTRRSYSLVKNVCKTTVTYFREGETHSIPAGGRHRWTCFYNRGETALGGVTSTLWGCSRQ